MLLTTGVETLVFWGVIGCIFISGAQKNIKKRVLNKSRPIRIGCIVFRWDYTQCVFLDTLIIYRHNLFYYANGFLICLEPISSKFDFRHWNFQRRLLNFYFLRNSHLCRLEEIGFWLQLVQILKMYCWKSFTFTVVFSACSRIESCCWSKASGRRFKFRWCIYLLKPWEIIWKLLLGFWLHT